MIVEGFPSYATPKAVAKMRGLVTVIERPWGWERGERKGDALTDAITLAHDRGVALGTTQAASAAFRRKATLLFFTLPVAGILLGLFYRSTVVVLARVIAAVRLGVYWKTVGGGATLLISSVGASVIASVLILMKRRALKTWWFWALIAAVFAASIVVVQMSQPAIPR
jgi:predicted secreted protein